MEEEPTKEEQDKFYKEIECIECVNHLRECSKCKKLVLKDLFEILKE